jgi:hypothetical protein
MSEETQTGTPPQVEQSSEPVTPEQANLARERAAFETYVKDQGAKVPENFNDTGAWFDSLKEAQGQYTQARQEIAQLKEQYAKTGEIGERQPQQSEQPVQQSEPDPNRELRITEKVEPPPPSMQESWTDWQSELATTGDFTPETRNQIKSAMNVDDNVVDTFIAGQKALRKEAYDNAATVVGGQDNLNTILDWAAKGLDPAERDELNSVLATPAYKTALMGLQARYTQEMANKPKQQEPAQVANRENAAQTSDAAMPIKAFETREQMNHAMSDPRYRTDPEYRAEVEARLIKTMDTGILIR